MSVVEEKILKPKQYQKMIQELDIENFELKTSSIFEAKLTLIAIKRLEEELLEIKRSVSADMRSIKLKYIGHDYSKSSFFGLKKANVVAKRKSLNNKCNRELVPYDNLLFIIDDYIKQIEDVKDYISDIKA